MNTDSASLNIEWFKTRDTLLGRNYVKQDVKRALELASTCQHPDAQWLSKIFAGKDVSTAEEAKNVFLAHENDDARALCFASMLSDPFDTSGVYRAAELGNAFAQSVWAQRTANVRDVFRFAHLSTLQGEPLAFLVLGRCYSRGVGCEKNSRLAKANYLAAAELGCVR